ncbi:MAG: hypothetical protein A3H57_02250 [Candidatus Taylorbacteria bacterium RIFCSPLOWO2_02_FULL_43_11]|uniref:Uncharacterized protein n=1 Tax=Candidatus Taylorbacteria bacterium RIFCSPHIGHO2_02_FULL_43_32b TaxID=1802306 RepID=A0A1G2MKT2_9BACT|nr:MAG: hypothetical protein A2743_02235 [Candidatus Taylorbacteria bacterium RIFCSPHIGHO2_01_FULL_43_47]OHA24458.1 MAG: hypothetical protein A3C72_04440 [Candidatus Taylorbacteria bacterium RIFCSPHIGHO2_02_FULL_43_32b]OHA35358.1 MAG: hypothetical protein A3H57_02250 [Candidatus Taylorbacteria bacterium RIFCSPLOWO2_02_FULL_43_11]
MIRKRKITAEPLRKSKARVLSIPEYARLSMPFSILIIAIALIGYVALTSFTVYNTAARSSSEEKIKEVSLRVSEHESKLSLLESKITAKLAASKGFSEPSRVKYINAAPLSAASAQGISEI